MVPRIDGPLSSFFNPIVTRIYWNNIPLSVTLSEEKAKDKETEDDKHGFGR